MFGNASIWPTRAARTEKRTLSFIILALLSILLILVTDVSMGGSSPPVRTVTVSVTETTSVTSSVSAASAGTSLGLSGAFPYPGLDCLFEVPQNATLGEFGAAEVQGVSATVVTFPNGVNASFPVVGCPQPVDHEHYQMAMLAVANSSFVAKENGSEYYYAGIGPMVILPGNRSAAALLFNAYSNETLSGCNKTYGLQILGQIQVFFFPPAANSPPVLSDPNYSYVPGNSFASCQ
jgi:hypothetical protein